MTALLSLSLLPHAAHADEDDAGALTTMMSGDAALPPPTPLTAPQTLYLEVTLNSAPRGLLPFIEAQGRLQASPATLRQLGFAARGEAPVYLDQISGVVVRYDANLQTLALEAPLQQLDLPTTELGPTPDTAPAASVAPGVVFNYDLYGSHSQGASNLTLTQQLRLFGVGQGVVETSSLLRTYRQPGQGGWQGESVRLDTRWRLDLPEAAVTLTVGDFYSGFVDWSRPVRMGGIQVGRNYGLQPYRVLSPTPRFLGEAVVPSTVELYVDGLRQYNGEVPVGPFQLAAQPGISGTGNAQVVITDAYGRMQTLDFAFYGTQQLLGRGLSDWSAGAGRMRRDYGVHSFAYDSALVGSATWRRGVTDGFTAEAHAEGGGGVGNIGIGGGWLLGTAGVLTAAYAHGRQGGQAGGLYSLGYNWNSRLFNVNLLSRRTHGHYRDLGALQGTLAPSISEQATVGLSLARAGSLSVSYLRLRYPGGDDDRYASLFWSRSLGQRWSAYLSLNQNLGDSRDRNAYLSFSVDLGNNRQGSVSTQYNGGRPLTTADVFKPVPGDGSQGGMGWRLQARGGDEGVGGLAELGWLNRVGRYSLGYARQGGWDQAYASASGSLVWMGGHVFAAREINDAFAIVSTGDIGGVPVRLENRLIGSTNADGLLLISPLLSWQRNRVSIDTLDLPANYRADRVDAWVTPRQGAGTGVSFGLRRTRAVELIVQDADGQPLPLGTQLQAADGRTFPVGHEGRAYLEDLEQPALLQATTPEGVHCQVQVKVPAATAPRSALPQARCTSPAGTP